jgi:hypothetical protein
LTAPKHDEPKSTPPTGEDLANDYFEQVIKPQPHPGWDGYNPHFIAIDMSQGGDETVGVRITMGPDGPVLEFLKPEDIFMQPGEPTDSVPHEIDMNPTNATEIAADVTLFTRNGAKIGNAMVIREVKASSEAMAEFLLAKGEKLWLIETDFGNRVRMSNSEINSLFTLGYLRDHDRWWEDRLAIIKHHQTDQSKFR